MDVMNALIIAITIMVYYYFEYKPIKGLYDMKKLNIVNVSLVVLATVMAILIILINTGIIDISKIFI